MVPDRSFAVRVVFLLCLPLSPSPSLPLVIFLSFRPILGAGAEEQGIAKAFCLKIVEQILVRPNARIDRILAAVPFVEHKSESPPPALVEKQIPA